ncbi:hypothetical protein [Streptomyces virginiae]|uniref:hypothetical protein n=1 Tax=Streptomyces virginiae TaxID=1961 RepID=UPI0036EC3034
MLDGHRVVREPKQQLSCERVVEESGVVDKPGEGRLPVRCGQPLADQFGVTLGNSLTADRLFQSVLENRPEQGLQPVQRFRFVGQISGDPQSVQAGWSTQQCVLVKQHVLPGGPVLGRLPPGNRFLDLGGNGVGDPRREPFA